MLQLSVPDRPVERFSRHFDIDNDTDNTLELSRAKRPHSVGFTSLRCSPEGRGGIGDLVVSIAAGLEVMWVRGVRHTLSLSREVSPLLLAMTRSMTSVHDDSTRPIEDIVKGHMEKRNFTG